MQELAKTVDDNGGVFFVPAFSGLFAPYWRDDARGVIVGLTAYVNRGHIARAALEAAAWQSREVVDAANEVADVPFTDLRAPDGRGRAREGVRAVEESGAEGPRLG